MSDPLLPVELCELEREWARRDEAPSASFESRLLGEVRTALLAQRRDRRAAFALSAAAALLIGLHVAWQASGTTFARRDRGIDRIQLTVAAKSIQALLPELSTEEAERQAMLMTVNVNRGRAALGTARSGRSEFAFRSLFN